jgi:hypothetical protein
MASAVNKEMSAPRNDTVIAHKVGTTQAR